MYGMSNVTIFDLFSFALCNWLFVLYHPLFLFYYCSFVLLPPPPQLRQCISLFAVAEWWLSLDIGWFVLFLCHSDSASVILYFTFLSHLFPLPCGAGSTVPREGFDSNVIMPFSWCVVAVTLPSSYIVSVHIQCQASIYTLSLCRGHSWRVRLAKQETLTPPGHLVSPLVCRGPWMSTVVLYCWCHSDSASVILYFTLCLPFL